MGVKRHIYAKLIRGALLRAATRARGGGGLSACGHLCAPLLVKCCNIIQLFYLLVILKAKIIFISAEDTRKKMCLKSTTQKLYTVNPFYADN